MIQNLLNETIGGLQVLLRHKEIYTALVHTNQPIDTPLEEFDTQIIKMVEETPKFPIDFEMFSFTKTFCDAEFITGNQIMQFDDNVWPEFYRSRKDFQEIKKQEFLARKNFVISKKLTPLQIQTHPFFKKPHFTNYITVNPNIQESKSQDFGNYNTIVPAFSNFFDAAQYFRTLIKQEDRVFYDVGPQCLHQVLDLLDLYIITIYSGQLDEKLRVGKMPNFDTIQKKFKLTYKSQVYPQHKGYIQFLVFEK
ncbi:unnamed protein product [Paramecium octaurelia]|uniref:Uncharacterized protein n=1 Tax=Paramecium octaurelia TaxID=43137 RepID=A0A8S1WPK0_PAROT|nr:unnamed protein product [Paramecium octaurelia]